jgi:hypothetical protein
MLKMMNVCSGSTILASIYVIPVYISFFFRRFDYSVPFLQWALTQPDYLADWHVGVRNTKTGALMGCITAVPVNIRVYDQTRPMAEINFLCVHKKLRTKRLAPVLIKEITRRVNLTDRWQAVYTAGVVLPKPVGRCRYYHRSLNPKKLIEVCIVTFRLLLVLFYFFFVIGSFFFFTAEDHYGKSSSFIKITK